MHHRSLNYFTSILMYYEGLEASSRCRAIKASGALLSFVFVALFRGKAPSPAIVHVVPHTTQANSLGLGSR